MRQTEVSSSQRAPLWIFEEAATIRHKIIQRAGRLTRPHGRLRLTLSGNEATRIDFLQYMELSIPRRIDLMQHLG